MKEKIEKFFVKALCEPKAFDKDDIKQVGEKQGLEFTGRVGKEKVIQDIIDKGYFSDLYEAFSELVYIPVWEVADYYNLNTEQIDKLQQIGIIKEEPISKEFYSRKDKNYYTANTYNIDVLKSYAREELKEAYKEAYEQDGYRTRIEAETEEEIQNLINELKKNFKIEKVDTYPKRNEGYHCYFTIKKLNNSKNEENAMLVEIQKLKNENIELRKKHREEIAECKKSVLDLFEVDNMIQLRKKKYKLKKLEEEAESRQSIVRNERGAGRKSKFTDEEKENIRLAKHDKTIKEIAEVYGCSVGLIHKIINE